MCQTVVIKSKNIEIDNNTQLFMHFPNISFFMHREYRGFCLNRCLCHIDLAKTFQMNNIKFEQKGNQFIIE